MIKPDETSALLDDVLALLHETPFGHVDGRLITGRGTTDGEIVGWVKRIYAMKERLRDALEEGDA